MKTRPILFSGPMVRAILEGKKTQTRRVIKRPRYRHEIDEEGLWIEDLYGDFHKQPCPYGQPGDRLWVRETWAEICHAGDAECHCDEECPKNHHHVIEYRADSGNSRPGNWPDPTEDEFQDAPRWRPSIHMPRWASRITLEITDVRVERLQDISHEDARAEGVESLPGSFELREQSLTIFQLAFSRLWDSLAKPGSTWADNPWVFAIEFKRIGGAS